MPDNVNPFYSDATKTTGFQGLLFSSIKLFPSYETDKKQQHNGADRRCDYRPDQTTRRNAYKTKNKTPNHGSDDADDHIPENTEPPSADDLAG